MKKARVKVEIKAKAVIMRIVSIKLNLKNRMNLKFRLQNHLRLANKPFGFGKNLGLALEVDSDNGKSDNSDKNVEIPDDHKNQEIIDLHNDEDTKDVHTHLDDGIMVEGMESTGDISYKWVEALKNIQNVEKGIQFKYFFTNYALRSISHEFKLIRKLTETKYHSEQIAKRQKGKDRYGDLGPFKHSQVKLRSKEKAFDTTIDNYINANHIRSAKQRNNFIATQGPLDTTCLNFWRMVWQEKVSLIVMLCPLKEGEKRK